MGCDIYLNGCLPPRSSEIGLMMDGKGNGKRSKDGTWREIPLVDEYVFFGLFLCLCGWFSNTLSLFFLFSLSCWLIELAFIDLTGTTRILQHVYGLGTTLHFLHFPA